jgi:RNA polymerase sigma factor for flagellar operon FliA
MDDLVSMGLLGALRAVKDYDPRKGVRLETYASLRIRGAIRDGLRTLDFLPRSVRKASREADEAFRTLAAKLGRVPSAEEMAGALGITLERWHKLTEDLQAGGAEWLNVMRSAARKDSLPGSDGAPRAKNENHQFDLCYGREQREVLDACLERLPERERKVVQLYYRSGVAIRGIANELGVHQSRVSQLHRAALDRLRQEVKRIISLGRPGIAGRKPPEFISDLLPEVSPSPANRHKREAQEARAAA